MKAKESLAAMPKDIATRLAKIKTMIEEQNFEWPAICLDVLILLEAIQDQEERIAALEADARALSAARNGGL